MRKLAIGVAALVLFSSPAWGGGDDKDKDKDRDKCSPAKVEVGYADNFDGRGSFFPPIWGPITGNPQLPVTCIGDPNCKFIGAPALGNGAPSPEWDAGAIEITNPSTTEPLVVNGVTLDIGPVTGIDPWGPVFFPQTIPPGNRLILTQVGGIFDFDTSDFPPSASSPSCIQNTFVPLIHLDLGSGANQIIRTFADTSMVLNTGGIDIADCPPGANKNEGHAFVPAKQVHNECKDCDRADDDREDD